MDNQCRRCRKTYRVLGAEPPLVSPNVQQMPYSPNVQNLMHACGEKIATVWDKPRIEFYEQGPDGKFQPSTEYFFDPPEASE
jgi:hypothetical protein